LVQNPALPVLDRTTLDALAETLCVVDANGRILAVNRAWSEFALANGADPGRVGVDANYLDVCDAGASTSEAAQAAAAGLRAVLSGQSAGFRLEYPCHGPEEDRWFQMQAMARPLHGAPGAVVIHRDITERHRAVEALGTERDLGATILAVTPALVLVLDRDGRVTRFNAACERASALRAADVLGKSFSALSLVPEEAMRDMRRAWDEILAGGEPGTLACRWVSRNGEQRDLVWNVAATPDGTHLVASAADVTPAREGAERTR
jgi:PAS domain S-box-containing protein